MYWRISWRRESWDAASTQRSRSSCRRGWSAALFRTSLGLWEFVSRALPPLVPGADDPSQPISRSSTLRHRCLETPPLLRGSSNTLRRLYDREQTTTTSTSRYSSRALEALASGPSCDPSRAKQASIFSRCAGFFVRSRPELMGFRAAGLL